MFLYTIIEARKKARANEALPCQFAETIDGQIVEMNRVYIP